MIGGGVLSNNPILRFHRNLQHPIDRFQVLGDRCSGTNFISHLIERNFPGISRSGDLDWKHGFIDRRICANPGLLTAIVYRHPVRWIQSVYANPYEVAPSQSQLPFDAFIRAEWNPVWFERKKDGSVTYIPIQGDMYPHTTTPFENICRMRSVKVKYLEEIASLPSQVVYLRYEDANRRPRRFIRELATAFGLEPARSFRPVREYKGVRAIRYRPARYPELAPSDLAFLQSELDLEQEVRIGYNLHAPAPMDGLMPWARPALRGILSRREPGSWFPGRSRGRKSKDA